MDAETKRMIEKLAKKGIKVVNTAPTTKKTYEVTLEHVSALDDIAHRRGIKIKEAVAEMFEMWIKKWGKS